MAVLHAVVDGNRHIAGASRRGQAGPAAVDEPETAGVARADAEGAGGIAFPPGRVAHDRVGGERAALAGGEQEGPLAAAARRVAEFVEFGDYPTLADTLPISRIAMDEFTSGRVDRVFLVYPAFVNTAVQRPTVRQLLPVQPPERTEALARNQVEYIYEPSPEAVLEQILPRYVEMQVYEAVLENSASEQSARMVAMKNASDAAKDMIDSLTLAMNKARQEQITRELLDLVGGVAALEG